MLLDEVFADDLVLEVESEEYPDWVEGLLDMIEDDLDQESNGHITRAMDLFSLYVSRGGPHEPARNLIDRYKHKVVKYFLENIKFKNYYLASRYIDMLHKLDVDWPEFDIMKKSLAGIGHKISIAEESEEVGYPASEVVDRIRNLAYHAYAILHGLEAMRHDDISPSIQRKSLEPYAKEIADFWDKVVSEYPRNVRVIAQIFQLLSIGADWPALHAVIDKNKDKVIWYILTRVKESIENNTYEGRLVAKNIIEWLKGINITWPELDAILKSIDAPKKVTEEFENYHESQIYYRLLQYSDIGGIWLVLNKVYEYEIDLNKNPMVRRMFNENKTVIIKDLLEDMKSGDYECDLFQWRVKALEKIGIAWPELDVIRRSIKADTFRFDEVDTIEPGSHYYNRIADDLEESDGERYFDRILDDLKYAREEAIPHILADIVYYYNRHPDVFEKYKASILELLEKNKKAIIKWMLYWLKNLPLENALYVIKPALICFKKIGVNWSELDIIRKSITANNTVTEARDSQDIYAELKAAVKFHGIWKVIQHMADYGHNVNDVPQANEMFEEYKSRIVKELLQHVKDGDGGYANRWISQLYEVGITWPELGMIRKSIVADRNARLKSGIAEDNNPDDLKEISRPRPFTSEELPALKNAYNLGKDVIIKNCLINLKAGYFQEVADRIGELRSLGITWPELDTIEHSLRDQKDVNLGRITDMFKNVTEDDNREDILNDEWFSFVSDMNEGNTSSAVIYLKRYLQYGGSVERARKELEKHKERILTSLKITATYANIGLFNHITKVLSKVGITWPETNIDNYKGLIVKYLLSLIKRESYSTLEDILRNLKNNGQDWPELEIISRSLEHEIQKTIVGEAKELKQPTPYWIEFLEFDFKDDNMPNVYSTIAQLKRNGVDIRDPKIIAMFNEYKTVVVKHLLKFVRTSLGQGKEYLHKHVDRFLRVLKQLKLAWPELATIEKSWKVSRS